LLKDRYEGWGGVVTEIDRDLHGLQHNSHPPLADAARAAMQHFHWLARFAVDDRDSVLGRAEELRVQLQAFKRYPDRSSAGGRKDWGECVTLAYAEHLPHVVVVVANENAARALCNKLNIPAASAVDILRAMAKDATITPGAAFAMYGQMTRATDAGDVITSAADFVRPKR
jgi:hypothetical protein